jgi:hypothetical protein
LGKKFEFYPPKLAPHGRQENELSLRLGLFMVEKNIIIASLEIARGVTNYGMVRNSDSGSYIV